MRKVLNELESGRLLSRYGIPVAGSEVLTSSEEKVLEGAAEKLGFPVAMKILSDDIQHKTDLGCVRLKLNSVAEMSEAYEEILANAKAGAPKADIQGVLVQQMLPDGFEVLMGVSTDPQFGPVIMVGLGGIYVELLQAVSLRMLPIDRRDAEEMIEETPLAKVYREGLRGVHYDKEELTSALLCLSRLVSEHPEIAEIDVNPFLLFGEGKKAVGVDAMVVIHE